jgi:anti-sigma factor ChrR (cupin superfamily)
MEINMDLTERVVIRPEQQHWVQSPTAGVTRVLLDRRGGEVARATSFVRYAPGSAFPEHSHGGGEEILVLEGIFADENGAYPSGTYLRNPRGTKHKPRSELGCRLFVKLHQFQSGDSSQVNIDSRQAGWLPGSVDGLEVLPLHGHGAEMVALVRWAPGTVFKPHTHAGGEEIVVLQGTFEDEYGAYPAGTWIRSPHHSRHAPFSREGCLIYVHTGHLQP